RYAQARVEFEQLRLAARDGDRTRAALRIAQCDYYLKKLREAKLALKPLAESSGTLQPEALYFYALSLRALKENESYSKVIRRVPDEFPPDPWADDALDNLGDYLVVHDEDELADKVYRDLYARFPKGRNA